MWAIYGVLPVLEALRAGGRRIDRIVIAEGAKDARLREVIEAARRAHIPVRREPRVALDRLTHNGNHQGVLAITSAAGYADADDLLAKITPTDHFHFARRRPGPSQPRSHHSNSGVRRSERGCCAGSPAAHLTDAVSKTSAGAVEHLPLARVTNLGSFIEELKKRNVWVVGIESSGEMAYTEFNYSGALALVCGGEGSGLHRLVRERCDAVVSIPMRGKVTSLNVSVAVGVVLFEALRQRISTK